MTEGKITIWCLLGRKAGDNTQVVALAEELGWGYVEKRILARPWELLVHLGSGATLAGIDQSSSSELRPPWPDLVISAGRRNEPVAQWIREQSGGRSRLVHIGRPWAPLDSWDLVVTTPQYFLPAQDNILHNSLPLYRMSPEQMSQAAAQLAPQVADLPRPRIALLVGGDSGRFVFTQAKGERLGSLADELALTAGGSLLVTDSPRTPRAVGDALQARLSCPHYCYRWGDPGENPYRGILGLADAFIVTGESMSMLGEAAAMGRPLLIFDMGDGDTRWWAMSHSYRYKPLSHRFAMRFGPQRMRRDVGNIQDALVTTGRAAWLEPGATDRALEALGGDATPGAENGAGRADEELRRAAEAVRRLVIPR